jgi:hypothetical protein
MSPNALIQVKGGQENREILGPQLDEERTFLIDFPSP